MAVDVQTRPRASAAPLHREPPGEAPEPIVEARAVREDLRHRQGPGARPARRRPHGRGAARWSRSWARPAAARRRCSTASPASTRSTPARSLIEGTSLASMSDRERTDYRARRMGFVFQFYNLLPVLSAVENVELPLLVAGVPARGGAAAGARGARAGRPRRLGRPRARELSGGQRQRVTIARALVNDPAIVWADEPTGDLDSENADEIMELMRRAQPRARPDLRDRHPRHRRRPPDRPHRPHARRPDRRGQPTGGAPCTRASRCLRSTPSAPTSTARVERFTRRIVLPELREQARLRGRARARQRRRAQGARLDALGHRGGRRRPSRGLLERARWSGS